MEKMVMKFEQNFWQGKKVFLTGHTGFKGSWMSFLLWQLKAEVFGYSLKPNTEPNLFESLQLEKKIQSHIGDIRNLTELKTCLDQFQPEIVIHMAAQPLVRYSYNEPIETFATNILGTAHVLQAMRNIPSIKSAVIVTTDKVYENPEKGLAFKENDPLGGHDPYSSSKACAEIITAAMRNSFFAESKTLIASARAGNVIGGGDWSADRLIPDFVKAMASDKPIVIRSPKAIRPWQHVLEPVCAYLILAQKLYAGETTLAKAWNFGPLLADAQSVQYVTEKITELWGNNAKWQLDQKQNPHEAHFLKLDISQAKETLGWQPKWNLEVALKKTVQWYQAYLANPSSAEKMCSQQIQEYLK